MPKRYGSFVGHQFDRWLVIAPDEPDSRGRRRWFCRCNCGTERVVPQYYLLSGDSRSCGCLLNEARKTARYVHGHGGGHVSGDRKQPSSEYAIWASMKSRCYRKSTHSYRFYGARGIQVCERWRNSFVAFLEDMGCRPSTRHSLDRIDSNGHYEPTNCRWATSTEQARNSRNARMITLNGETRCINEWAAITGIKAGTLAFRIRQGWDAERALTTPPGATGGNRHQASGNA